MEKCPAVKGVPSGIFASSAVIALASSFINRKYKDAVRLVPAWSMFRPSGGEIQALSFFESVLQGGKTGGFRGSGSLGNALEVHHGTRDDPQFHPFDPHP